MINNSEHQRVFKKDIKTLNFYFDFHQNESNADGYHIIDYSGSNQIVLEVEFYVHGTIELGQLFNFEGDEYTLIGIKHLKDQVFLIKLVRKLEGSNHKPFTFV